MATSSLRGFLERQSEVGPFKFREQFPARKLIATYVWFWSQELTTTATSIPVTTVITSTASASVNAATIPYFVWPRR
jgi:hypothetical protein